MRPGDTESHRHSPQPARTPRCSRTPPSRPAGSPRWLHAGRLATTTLAIARFRHNPRDLGQFPFRVNGNCPRSAGSHQPDRAIRLRRRASRSGDGPSGSGDPAICLRRAPAGIMASASGEHPASRRPPRAGTRRRGISPHRRRIRSQRASDVAASAPGAAAPAPGRRRDVRDQRPGACRTETEMPLAASPGVGAGFVVRFMRGCQGTEMPLAGTPGCGCRPAVGVVLWSCRAVRCCGSAVVWVSCSSAGRRGRWPAAPTGRRRPGRPTPARSARRRSAPCPATRRPASDP
ncbi:hypothetical protein GA0070561_5778 [Micromonospora saelicesensis]|uniref:Uncharacterized protein n=1 Tax=Micromonospora saelicesensis TaxID=285676 RepID=A0A1C4ZTQ2_9ACTN|nr:hypothetical protein GA0070561_5778 [Micromonospora saelicesensis]